MQRSPSISPYQSDDEVVWSLSESSASFSVLSSAGQSSVLDNDDDDFVVLSKATSSDRRRTRRSSDFLSGSGSELSDGQYSEEEEEELPESPTTCELPRLDLLEISGGDAAASPSPSSSSSSSPSSPPSPNSLISPQEVVDAPKTPTPGVFETQLQPLLPEAARESAATPVAVQPPETVLQEAKKLTKAQRRRAARQRKKQAKLAKESTEKTTAPSDGVKKVSRRRRRAARKAAVQRTNGAVGGKPVVNSTPPELYEEASLFITSFLENPVAKQDPTCRLTLLQSFIVELGFASTGLPTSLRAARAFLKARAFINIRDYLASRKMGQAAIQKLLHPSKKALIKDIKRKGHTVSCKWVKEQGLEVLLVPCFCH